MNPIPISKAAADLLKRAADAMNDDELRSWVIAYGPGRAHVGKPAATEFFGVHMLRLSPAFIFASTIGRVRGPNGEPSLVRDRLIAVPEMFEADDGVIVSLNCTIVSLRECTARDLADLRSDIVGALATRAAIIEQGKAEGSRIAMPSVADLAEARKRGIIQ